MDVELETATGMAQALAVGDVSSRELVEEAVRRAEEWQSASNAFSQLWADEAVAMAMAFDALGSDARRRLRGVPVAVKDLFDVAGHETTGCSRSLEGTFASADAPTVARARAAGLVLIGKTNQHELAAGGTNLVSSVGRTANPWDPDRITGGSSGGSAAAVAAGVLPWAFGSDTGGSIRIPGSMCGVFGLKPGNGVLTTEGMLPLAPSMDCPGPIASTASDLAWLYRVMSGREGGLDSGLPSSRVRLGMPDGFFRDRIHPEVVVAVEEVGRLFLGEGAEVEVIDGGGLHQARRAWKAICYSEFSREFSRLGATRDAVSTSVLEWIEEGERLPQDEIRWAWGRREEISRWFRENLRRFEALVIPTTPYSAFRADDVNVDLGRIGVVDWREVGPGWLTCTINLAGLPAVNLPAGRSGGLPVGVSLVGAQGSEETLLALAALWEKLAGYRPLRPVIPK